MNNQINGNSDDSIPPIIGNTEEEIPLTGLDISQSIISKLNDSQSTTTEVKKQKEPVDTSYIYEYVAKYGIEEVVISNLQKLQEKELINVPFFQQLRKIFNPQMIKSKLMKGLGIRESYTGFHEFMKGERADLPNVGICNIAKTIGYDVMIVPVPENITKLEMDRLNLYKQSFLQAIENKIVELNIPQTRTRTKDKDKPKEINTAFIENLSKSEEEFLSELKTELPIEASGIGINDVFDDGQGEIEIESKQFLPKKVKETSLEGFGENINIDEYPLNSIAFDPDEFGEEDYLMGIDSLEDINALDPNLLTGIQQNQIMVDMGDYEDSLHNLRKIDETDEFMFGENEEIKEN